MAGPGGSPRTTLNIFTNIQHAAGACVGLRPGHGVHVSAAVPVCPSVRASRARGRVAVPEHRATLVPPPCALQVTLPETQPRLPAPLWPLAPSRPPPRREPRLPWHQVPARVPGACPRD